MAGDQESRRGEAPVASATSVALAWHCSGWDVTPTQILARTFSCRLSLPPDPDRHRPWRQLSALSGIRVRDSLVCVFESEGEPLARGLTQGQESFGITIIPSCPLASTADYVAQRQSAQMLSSLIKGYGEKALMNPGHLSLPGIFAPKAYST